MQGLSALAAVLGTLGAVAPGANFEAWVATLGIIGAAIRARAISQRSQRLAASYRITADRLALRLGLWELDIGATPNIKADYALVIDCEAIIGNENEAWLTESWSSRSTEGSDLPAAPQTRSDKGGRERQAVGRLSPVAKRSLRGQEIPV